MCRIRMIFYSTQLYCSTNLCSSVTSCSILFSKSLRVTLSITFCLTYELHAIFFCSTHHLQISGPPVKSPFTICALCAKRRNRHTIMSPSTFQTLHTRIFLRKNYPTFHILPTSTVSPIIHTVKHLTLNHFAMLFFLFFNRCSASFYNLNKSSSLLHILSKSLFAQTM